MADDGMEIFIRWVLRHGVRSDRVRPYLTLASLLCDNEMLVRLQHDAPVGSLDEALLEEFLSLAVPREAVAILKGRIGPHISPEMFKRAFQRTLAESSDIEVLSGLMWVAGMYLDRHPGAFQLPRELADQLLASEELDHRLAGLKALRHTGASSTEILVQITGVLKRDDWHEKWAGLSQLRQLLEEKGPTLADATEQRTLEELQTILEHLADTDPDANARRAAAHCSVLLGGKRNGKR